MYTSSSVNHPRFHFISFGLSFTLAIIIAMYIPSVWIDPTLIILSNVFFQILLYITIPYLFFSLLISSYELHKSQQFIRTFALIAGTGLVLCVAIVLVSIITFIFIPTQSFVSLSSSKNPDTVISISDIVNNIFSIRLTETPYATQVLLVPFYILAIVIGVNASAVLGVKHPLLESCNAFRNINLRILERVFPFLIIPILVMTVRNFSTMRVKGITQFSSLIIFLIATALVLSFIVYPILIFGFKIPISYKLWCQRIIPAITTAFSGANMTIGATALVYVDDHSSSNHKVTDTSICLSFVFARVGTALTIALTYITLNENYTNINLSMFPLFIVFISSVIASILTNAIAPSIIITSIASLSQFRLLQIEDFYSSIVPLLIILHAIASTIDTVSAGFVKLYVSHRYNTKHKLNLSRVRPQVLTGLGESDTDMSHVTNLENTAYTQKRETQED